MCYTANVHADHGNAIEFAPFGMVWRARAQPPA